MKKIIGMLVLATLFTSCGFEIVDDGYVGIKKSMGKIEKEEYKPGLHFYNPLTTSISEMEIREKTWESKLVAYSSDNQIIEVAFKANYQPISSQMAELYTSQGRDYINIILPQRVTAPTKEVLGKYKATTLVSVRAKASAEISEEIKHKLEGTGIILTSFEITNFDYDDAFEAAVKAKIVAKERAIEEQNKTVQVKEQATQKVLTAKADATAIEVMAKALAKNKSIVELKAVEKWNGVLPQYMMGGQSTPFINIR